MNSNTNAYKSRKILVILLVFAQLVSGESLKILPENRITLFDDLHKVSIDIRKSDNSYKIIAMISGISIEVPEGELSGLSELNLRTVSLNYYHDGGGNIADKPLNGLVVGIKLGGAFDHGKEDNPVEVYSYLLIYFGDGKYKGWRNAVPVGGFGNQWIIYDKDVGSNVNKSDPVDMVDCPIMPSGVL